MVRLPRLLIAPTLLAPIALSACSGQMVPPATGYTPATRPASRPAGKLIGSTARDLIRQFGKPRLEIHDPAANKLQFANGRCVLDAYLYAPSGKREPQVSYVEARSPDGRDVDAEACAATLSGK